MWNPINLKNFGQCFYFNIVILTKLCPPHPKNNIDGERFRDQYAWLKKFMTQHQMSSHARILIPQIPSVESRNCRHETQVKQNVALLAWKKRFFGFFFFLCGHTKSFKQDLKLYLDYIFWCITDLCDYIWYSSKLDVKSN